MSSQPPYNRKPFTDARTWGKTLGGKGREVYQCWLTDSDCPLIIDTYEHTAQAAWRWIGKGETL